MIEMLKQNGFPRLRHVRSPTATNKLEMHCSQLPFGLCLDILAHNIYIYADV